MDTHTRNWKQLWQSHWVIRSKDHCNCSTHKVFSVFTSCLPFLWVPELFLAADTSLVGRLNCCWPSSAQSFLASVSSRSTTKIFILSQTCTYFEMGRPLRRERFRSFCAGATFVAPQFRHEYIRFGTASRSLWTPHPLSLHCSNICARYTERFPVNAGLCSTLCLNLCNYSETAISQLNGRRPDRRQV
jgi:hypothetical protein